LSRRYYFTDSSIIKDFGRLKTLITNPDNSFFYTETTRQDVGNTDVNSCFKFVESGLSKERKVLAIDMMNKRNHKLSEKQLRIIFEASSLQFREDVIPFNELVLPTFITGDFRLDEETDEALNQVSNLVGFDFCIRISHIDDIDIMNDTHLM
jgi:hypothetical protein